MTPSDQNNALAQTGLYFNPKRGPIGRLAWSSEGRLALPHESGGITLWSRESNSVLRTLEGHAKRAVCVTWSPHDMSIASGSDDKTLRIWNPEDGNVREIDSKFQTPVGAVAWRADGKFIAAGCNDGTVRVMDRSTGQDPMFFVEHKSFITSLAWHPRNNDILMSSSTDGLVGVWDVGKSRSKIRIEKLGAKVWWAAFSPDGEHVALALGDGTIRVLDAISFEEKVSLNDHKAAVTCLSYSSSGTVLASRSRDSTVRLWSTEDYSLMRTIAVTQSKLMTTGIAFDPSPNSSFLAVLSGGDEAVNVFKVETPPKIDRRVTTVEQVPTATATLIQPINEDLPNRDEYCALHLSDLHLTPDDDVYVLLQPLLVDLRVGLQLEQLDFIIVSGDFGNRASAAELEIAKAFLLALSEAVGVPRGRILIVPGNHDVDWEKDVYDWKVSRKVDLSKHNGDSLVQQGNGYLVRDKERYPSRFRNFREIVFEALTGRAYPSASDEQCIPFTFPTGRVQFLCVNSCWEIDEWHPERASINRGALARGLMKAREEIDDAVKAGKVGPDQPWLRIAIWHHPVTGDERIKDSAFLEHLTKEKFSLCLHGHVHEDRAELVGYRHPLGAIHVAGAGTFSATAKQRPESTPRLYNLLRLRPTNKQITVYTRKLSRISGAWDEWPVWSNGGARVGFYTIDVP